VTIDRHHAEALLALGLCAAMREEPAEAKRYLERAQRRRPHDGRIGLLLSQAAKALADQGQPVQLEAEMPPDELSRDEQALEHLSRIVEAEPDFVDAFLELPEADQSSEIDREVYAVLAETLNRALDRSPRLSALHCAAGRVLDQLGRQEEALAAIERAVDLDPGYVQGLVLLARLYQRTDRHQDALARLEQALRTGVRYADVYYMLGSLYHRNGWLEQARWAYTQALEINDRYEAARRALATLAA
jgi:tetratricopeptide (TPR) repeat protein